MRSHLTCVKAEAPVKTGNNTVAGVKAYTIVNTVNELERLYAGLRVSTTDTLVCFYRWGPRHYETHWPM